ncbi:MAG: DNA replication/repair protein RecF [Erysipelotrichaceae bacterium]
MIIQNIQLKDFRNFTNTQINFSDTITILIGDNAQGKTNLLEAVYFLSTGRSHRISEDKMCIKHGCESASIKGRIKNTHAFDLKVILHPLGKSLFYQNQLQRKSSEFIGKMNALMFSPSDMEVFAGSPKNRRRLIDLELGKINPIYMDLLSTYHKLLKDRNTYLKEKAIDDAYMEVLTQQMVEIQCELIRYKTAFINLINDKISGLFQKLELSQQKISIRYFGPVPYSDEMHAQLSEKYNQNLSRDKILKTTNVGIHRDEIGFLMDDSKVEFVASQGQMRMIVIALKCALVEVIEELTDEKPILLLDDVFSELDKHHRKALYSVLHQNTQTIISTTDLSYVEDWLNEDLKIWTIDKGEVIQRSRV